MKYPYQNHSLENLQGEQWEDIPGLDGMYSISNFGRVRREEFEILCRNGQLRTMRPKILRIESLELKNNTVGDFQYFLRVSITREGIGYKLAIARLVYYCFVNKFRLEDQHLVVLTNDGNNKNIHPENLMLGDIRRKQKRIFERGRLERKIITSFEEFRRHHKIKSQNPYCKQISQYTASGKKIQTFPSIKAASIATGVPDTSIIQVLKNRQLSTGGFVWRYGKKSFADVEALRAEHLQHRKKIVGQKVSQYNLKGKRLATYFSITDGAKAVGIRGSDISAVLKGDQRSAGGFIWKRGIGRKQLSLSNYLTGNALKAQRRQKKVKQFGPDGHYIRTFNSVKEAAQFLKVVPSYISLVINKKTPLRNFLWKFA